MCVCVCHDNNIRDIVFYIREEFHVKIQCIMQGSSLKRVKKKTLEIVFFKYKYGFKNEINYNLANAYSPLLLSDMKS